MADDLIEIKPQPKQESFLATSADIAIYGGGAGAGKSFSLLLEPLRHVTSNSDFYAVIFRRTTPQIRNPGGLWDESAKLYPLANGNPVQTILEWKWDGGGRVKMAHLEHDKTVYDWQGSQIPMIGFDEITHFTEAQFFYMLSRNRSMCGVRPYVRATCNPDADSWVAQFIEWWIDHNGFAIPERSGVLRWFVRVNGEIKWADTKEECISLHGFANLELDDPAQVQPKSVTFISASLDDNQELVKADPGYRSNLLALDVVSQARLLHGNWKIRWDSGMEVFREASLLDENMLPVEPTMNCDYVYCTIDTAMKDGSKNDGTAATFWARSKYHGIPLVILDWEYFQMEGSLLEFWLPSVFEKLDNFAKELGARHGSIGAFIEDKSSGTIILQQAKRRNLPAHGIDNKLTAMGKSERAISVSGYVHRGDVKISKHAYNKVVAYKGITKNYLVHNVTNFRVGVDNKQDDTTDTFTYGISIGNAEGF
jgi:phage terminase large subunit-like protein